MRLLVACQDSGIYIFETGQGSLLQAASTDISCQELFTGREEAEGAVDELLQREV